MIFSPCLLLMSFFNVSSYEYTIILYLFFVK